MRPKRTIGGGSICILDLMVRGENTGLYLTSISLKIDIYKRNLLMLLIVASLLVEYIKFGPILTHFKYIQLYSKH